MSSASPLAKDRSHRGPIAHEMACGCSKIMVFLLKNVTPGSLFRRPGRRIQDVEVFAFLSNKSIFTTGSDQGYCFVFLGCSLTKLGG